MIQQVNLYQVSRVRKAFWVSLRGQIGVTCALIVGLIGLTIHLELSHSALSTQHLALETSIQNTEQQIQRFNDANPEKKPSRSLRRALEETNVETAQIRKVINAIESKGIGFGNTDGFSSYLTGLARQHIDGLWLTNFELAYGGSYLHLKGNVTQAGLVPKYLENLSGESSFSGREFSEFTMIRPQVEDETESKWIEFSTHTRMVEES